MKKVFYIFILSHLSYTLFSQSNELQKDSLLELINNTSVDSIKINKYLSLAKLYVYNNPNKAIPYVKQALALSEKIHYNKGITNGYKRLFNIYFLAGKHTDSLLVITKKLENHLLATENERQLYLTHSLYGTYYSQVGQADKAISSYLNAIVTVRKDNKLQAKIRKNKEGGYYNNAGIVLYKNGQKIKALEYYLKGLKLVQNDRTRGSMLYNSGMIYNEDLNQPDSAMTMFDEAYTLFSETNNLIGSVAVLAEKAGIFDRQNQFERAAQLYQNAVQIVETNRLGYNAYFLYLQIAKHYELQGKHNDAILYGKKALELGKKQGTLIFLDKAYKTLHYNYAAIKDFGKAYEFSQLLIAIKDSISNTELKSKVEELQTQFDVEQTEIENELLKAESIVSKNELKNRTITSIALLLGLLLLSSWAIRIYLNSQRKQQYNQELERTVTKRTEQLAKANQNLEQANYELKAFNYIASHDIKEPIRNIGSYAGLVFRKLPPHQQINFQSYFETIKKSTEQLYSLIEDFSKYTQMSHNDAIEIHPVNMNTIIESLEVSLSLYTQERNGRIINEGLPIVQSSSSFLYTILKNLIENGLKFNETSVPTVTLNYEEAPTSHIIFVTDNGIGISSEYSEKIFEMFKRLHNREKYKGSGIGLAIVKLLLNKINGEIEVQSKVTEGTTFIIRLPK